MDNVAEAIKSFIDDALGVSILEMGIQIASTLLLFIVVKHFFWNNITEYLERRKNAITDEYTQAEETNKEAQLIKVQADNELNQIRLDAKGIFEEAKERGEKERSSIVKKAKSEALIVIEDAHKEIDSEIEKARTKINDEIVSVAALMAKKVIDKEIDMDKHKELIKEITNEVVN